MSRFSADLRYFWRTALRGMRASPVPTAGSVGTIAVALVLAGAFGLLLQNMESLLERLGADVRVTAYLEDDLSETGRSELAELVTTVEGVLDVQAVSQEEALERFGQMAGGRAGLLEALEENPLPASLEITLVETARTPEGLRVVVESIDGLPGIRELAHGQDWVEGYARAIALVRGLALAISCVLALATLLIVANTIQLAVYARRDELEILALVGASRGFVATPFLLEGLLQGAAGGVVAVAVLFAVFRLALPGLEQGLSLLLGFAAPRFFGWDEIVTLIGGGAALGLIGSAAAVVRERRE